jgi:hypothetical protein
MAKAEAAAAVLARKALRFMLRVISPVESDVFFFISLAGKKLECGCPAMLLVVSVCFLLTYSLFREDPV